jgi:hypothetical protein
LRLEVSVPVRVAGQVLVREREEDGVKEWRGRSVVARACELRILFLGYG